MSQSAEPADLGPAARGVRDRGSGGAGARRRHLPILRYRSVPHHSLATAAPGSVPASVLEEQLTTLAARGWQLVGVTEALHRLSEDRARRIVALTFDDGLLDFLNAFDVLDAVGARATLYIPSGSIGTRVSRWDRGQSKLGWEEIQHLSEAGMEIGSRAVSNRPLDAHPDAAVRTEVVESKWSLEDQLGRPITSFCYPGGLAGARVRRAVAGAGYSNACTIEPLPRAGRKDDVLALPRIRVGAGDTATKIDLLVSRGRPESVGTYLARAARPVVQMTWRSAVRALHAAVPRG